MRYGVDELCLIILARLPPLVTCSRPFFDFIGDLSLRDEPTPEWWKGG